MGFFSFVQEIAMDLGTANTIIIQGDKIVVDQPSVVAIDRDTNQMIAVGERAMRRPTTASRPCALCVMVS